MSAALTGTVALIRSSWHGELVERCAQHFVDAIHADPESDLRVDVIEVPGAFEIPLHAKVLAEQGRHCAVAATALVVDGGIYRHEFVAGAVIDGLMRVQLDTGVPVFSAVLTPHHFHEHDVHSSFFAQHLQTKGDELARACLATLASLQRLRDLPHD